MSFVKLKEKGQLTIPAAVRDQISAHTGDIFEVAVTDGNIVLKPKDVVSRTTKTQLHVKKSVDISSWLGGGRGLFQTREDADAFINRERASWD
jgi:AbrB family looped-hinge helix DNA binding protein